MLLRHARRDDLAALVAIYNDAIALRNATGHLEAFTVAERQAWFDGHRVDATPLFVAEIDGGVAGYATLAHYRGGRGAFHAVREISYYVAAERQRRGVASTLLGHALAACPALGVDTLLTFVLAHNGSSRAFLEHHGFALWGALPAVAEIDGRRYDHVIYGRRLG